MRTSYYLFHRLDEFPLENLKIKNASLRNKSIIVSFRQYIDEPAWKEFVSSFVKYNAKFIIDNQIEMDANFNGFILMYDDDMIGKKVIITDFDKILEELSIQ